MGRMCLFEFDASLSRLNNKVSTFELLVNRDLK